MRGSLFEIDILNLRKSNSGASRVTTKERKAKTTEEKIVSGDGEKEKKVSRAGAKRKPASGRKTAAKKTASKKRTRTAGKSRKMEVGEGTEAAGKADPFEVAKRTVKGAVPAIVRKMVQEAKGGSCTHAKTLLEMAGVKRMFEQDPAGETKDEPWARMVLEKLGEAERAGRKKEAAEASQEQGRQS